MSDLFEAMMTRTMLRVVSAVASEISSDRDDPITVDVPCVHGEDHVHTLIFARAGSTVIIASNQTTDISAEDTPSAEFAREWIGQRVASLASPTDGDVVLTVAEVDAFRAITEGF